MPEDILGYVVVSEKNGTPISIRSEGCLPDPVIFWENKQQAESYLQKLDAIDIRYKVVLLDQGGQELIAKGLGCALSELRYMPYNTAVQYRTKKRIQRKQRE